MLFFSFIILTAATLYYPDSWFHFLFAGITALALYLLAIFVSLVILIFIPLSGSVGLLILFLGLIAFFSYQLHRRFSVTGVTEWIFIFTLSVWSVLYFIF